MNRSGAESKGLQQTNQSLILMRAIYLDKLRAIYLDKLKASLEGNGFCLSRQIQESELLPIITAPVLGHGSTQH